MEQVIFGGRPEALDASATEFNRLMGGDFWTPTEASVRAPVSATGLFNRLRVRLNAAPGGAASFTFTLMVDGSPTAIAVTISGASTTGADTANTVAIAAGQEISLRCVPSGTPTVSNAYWTTMFTGTTAKESLILGGSIGTIDSASNRFFSLDVGSVDDLTEGDVEQIVPTEGTIKDFYVCLDADPGVSPEAYRFTLRRNTASQSVSVTITANDTAGNDLVNSFSVVGGDRVTVFCEPLNSPSVEPRVNWGCTFVSDVDGESVILGGTNDGMSDTTTERIALQTNMGTSWIPGAQVTGSAKALGQACTLKKLYIQLNSAPGPGREYVFHTHVEGANGDLTVTITDSGPTGSDLVNTHVVANGEYVSLEENPGSPTPGTREARWGVVSVGALTLASGAPVLAGRLGLVEPYETFFGETAIPELIFDLKLKAWREAISPKAFVLPTAGITGTAISLNAIDFILTLEGTIYGTHAAHPVTSGQPHLPDAIDLEEIAIMFNREGLANRAFVRLFLPSGAREYRGVIKSVKLEQRGGEFSVWDFTMTFQVLWTASFPQWRGWT